VTRTAYLVIWWMNQAPHAALYETEVSARASAAVRNALMITISGTDVKIAEIVDWYRRNAAGAPMPAEWRDPLGQIRIPWSSKGQASVG
jgi:hypothetical protein